MLSMPQGTDPRIVRQAAREFAQVELKDHSYVMVLHEHQANPHVHLAVRAESRFGARLNPRKADLHRWRETFAEKLRCWGIDAEATRQATRGANRNFEPLWRVKAKEEGRLRKTGVGTKTGKHYWANRAGAFEGWPPSSRRWRHPIVLMTASSLSVSPPSSEAVPLCGNRWGRDTGLLAWWTNRHRLGNPNPTHHVCAPGPTSSDDPTRRPAPRPWLKRVPSWPKAGQSLPPDGLGGLPPEVVASPARVSVLGLPRPVKGSLRRALPALDRTRQPERRGVRWSDFPFSGWPSMRK